MKNWLRTYRSQVDKQTRKTVFLWSTMFASILGIDVIILLQDEGTRLYYKGNNGLLILIILYGLAFIAVGKSIREMAGSFVRLLRTGREIESSEIPGVLMFLTLLSLTASVLFVLDLSFVKSYGVKIGAVIGVYLIKIIRDLISKYRSG
jgi:hypothetical protein